MILHASLQNAHHLYFSLAVVDKSKWKQENGSKFVTLALLTTYSDRVQTNHRRSMMMISEAKIKLAVVFVTLHSARKTYLE